MKLVAVDAVPEDAPIEVVADGRVFAVCRVADRIEVIDGICAHAGGPLGKGSIRNGVVTCPWHGWQFDFRTGQSNLNPRICQQHFPSRIEDGQVVVELD